MKSVSPESLCELVMLDDPQIAPDGASVVFVHSAVNRAGNSYTRNIWKAALSPSPRPSTSSGQAEGEQVAPYTASGKDGHPRWSPDGAWLGFISGRGGEAKVFGLPSAGGEAQILASHKNSISAFEWGADGAKIAFAASLIAADRNAEDKPAPTPTPNPSQEEGGIFKDDFASKQEKEKRDREEQLRNDPRVVNVFPYRSGTAFFEDRYRHVYVTDTPKNFAEKNDAKPVRLTDGELNYDAPYLSADGASVFSAVSRDPELGNLFRYKDAIQIPISQTEKFAHTKLAVDGRSCGGVLPSPNGRWLAMVLLGESDPGYNSAWLAVKDLTNPDAIPTDLTAKLDRNIVKFKWAKDSQHIYFTIESGGRINLWRVSVPGGEVEQLTDLAHDVTAFDVSADGRVVFVAATAHDPSALFVRETDGAIKAIYQPNKKFAETYALGETEEIWYASEGFKIQGWILKPHGFDAGKKYPLAVQIHGGPHVQWTGQFPSMFHENQLLAARGYVVFYCNPRGSDGYGEAFAEANRADWGEGPSKDVLAGVDEVIKRGYIDENRLAITGGSYGGYLTAWIIGHDHRFKAACSQRGVYNLISMRGTTDIPFFNDRESGATPWEDVNKLWDASPLKYAPDIQTPLLIEHSEQDYRVPIEQAEQMFAALRLLRKPVEMVRWPREGHELSRAGEPRHRIERVRRIVEWFDKYCLEEK